MTTDTPQLNHPVKAPVNEGRPVETLSPEARRRNQTVVNALDRLHIAQTAISRERTIHASVLQLLENAAALENANEGVKEWSASRAAEATASENPVAAVDSVAMSADPDSAQARADDAHTKLDGVDYFDLSNFEERLAAA